MEMPRGAHELHQRLPSSSCPPHHLFPTISLPYSLGKISCCNEETQNHDEYNTTWCIYLIWAILQVWTLAPHRWEYINKLASDGSAGPGILYWQSLGYLTQAYSCKSTVSEFTFAWKAYFQSFQSFTETCFQSILSADSNDLSKSQSQRWSKFLLRQNELNISKMVISLNTLQRPSNLNSLRCPKS